VGLAVVKAAGSVVFPGRDSERQGRRSQGKLRSNAAKAKARN
jgi:hypothetical protein